MEKLKRLIADWLGFSRTEVNGFLVLLPVMVLLIASEPVSRWYVSNRSNDFLAEKKVLDSLTTQWPVTKKNQHEFFEKSEQRGDSIFAFDPNKIAIKDLGNLGFSKNLSNRIANYRQKGGVFRIKRDLLKIYGMDSTLYHQLYTYILLPERVDETKKDVEVFSTASRKSFAAFDINKADTIQLKSIYGIGKVLAVRIINFRDRLGGFITPEQITEVYGVDSVTAKQLNDACYIEKTFEPKKININASDEKTLLAHPYIKKSMAKAILAYRFQHGDFADVRDLFKISIIPPQQAERLIPYLKLKD
jgi:DNA uptake protein ComE-like DNA-binding protein